MTDACPECRHASHASLGFCPNMASDNDCSCTYVTVEANPQDELEELKRKYAELEGALSWGTSCLACARMLDAAYEDTVRAEKAEAEVARLRQVLTDVRELADERCDCESMGGRFGMHREECPTTRLRTLFNNASKEETSDD